MLSFTSEETKKIRKRFKEEPRYAEALAKRTELVRSKTYIQEEGLAGWHHHYVCPKHGVFLNFNYYDFVHHVCPVDGEVFTGEQYDSAWWYEVLIMTAESCYLLSAAYLAGAQESYLEKAKEILMGYAKYYPSYEVHGNIPYNNPGKACAQTLDDSDFLNYLACGYDLIKDKFTKKEQETIENNLFREGAKYLMNNFTPQIHNHEVAICSTIGIIGLILDDAEIIDFALNKKYGLKYQLDHAVLSDGLWFECSTSYHLYALSWFIKYEKLAHHTKHSLLKDEHCCAVLYKMIVFFNKLLKVDNTLPVLNDGSCSLTKNGLVFEYAYSYFRTNEVLELLKLVIAGTQRDSEESLLYGVDDCEILNIMAEESSCGDKTKKHAGRKNYLSETGSQLAIIHGSDNRNLLLKATPYGGEHDHYDRLGISFTAFSKGVCEDMGTASGYGSPLHYGYFKNTASHNTVCINGDNMPPVETVVNCYKENAIDDVYLDISVDWNREFIMPDSFTIKQWVDDSYAGTRMRRIIQWYDKYFIDVFVVNAPNDFTKDYTLHVDGELVSRMEELEYMGAIRDKDPQQYLHDAYVRKAEGVVKSTYQCEGFELDVHTLADGHELIYALGPANPSVKDISYYILRSTAHETIYVNVIEAHKTGHAVIQKADILVQDKKVLVRILESNRERFFEVEI